MLNERFKMLLNSINLRILYTVQGIILKYEK